ncbi:MAG: hypothetical protein LBM08_00710 [Dysgonamonadaceae bacterium]|jgi:hypothetical protein|nr:hypothetical protein [Dysgonamonadaceae bacterium]
MNKDKIEVAKEIAKRVNTYREQHGEIPVTKTQLRNELKGTSYYFALPDFLIEKKILTRTKDVSVGDRHLVAEAYVFANPRRKIQCSVFFDISLFVTRLNSAKYAREKSKELQAGTPAISEDKDFPYCRDSHSAWREKKAKEIADKINDLMKKHGALQFTKGVLGQILKEEGVHNNRYIPTLLDREGALQRVGNSEQKIDGHWVAAEYVFKNPKQPVSYELLFKILSQIAQERKSRKIKRARQPQKSRKMATSGNELPFIDNKKDTGIIEISRDTKLKIDGKVVVFGELADSLKQPEAPANTHLSGKPKIVSVIETMIGIKDSIRLLYQNYKDVLYDSRNENQSLDPIPSASPEEGQYFRACAELLWAFESQLKATDEYIKVLIDRYRQSDYYVDVA